MNDIEKIMRLLKGCYIRIQLEVLMNTFNLDSLKVQKGYLGEQHGMKDIDCKGLIMLMCS